MKSAEYLDALANHINRFTNLSSSEKELLSEYVQFSNVKNKEYLLKAGQICTGKSFCSQGLLQNRSLTPIRALNKLFNSALIIGG